MKTRIAILVIIQSVVLLIGCDLLFAWTGETWGPISREEILRRASEMINLSWSPLKNISNQYTLSEPRHSYNAGTIYHGVAYNRYNDPVDNWAQFYPKVNSVSCSGTRCLTSYGNECSSFVSIAWRLPTRHNTTAFENDAVSDGGYATKLGEIGSGQNVARSLLPGDAFVSAGNHIVLFEQLYYNPDTGSNDGIYALEQTPPYAVRKSFWSWDKLRRDGYRPIRRNKIDEGNYTFVTKWGGRGSGSGQFLGPTGLAIDLSGNVLAADSGNDRIQKFNSNGGYLAQWGGRGSGSGQFLGPTGLAIDLSGNVLVADSGNDRIQKFNGNGGYLAQWGGFDQPSYIAVDSAGYFYATDSNNFRIQKFNSNGGFITTWGNYGWPAYLTGIAVDSFGKVYVADKNGYNLCYIRIYDGTGNPIGSWCSSYGTGFGQFDMPWGMAVDLGNNIYVADAGNNRIQRFYSDTSFNTAWSADESGNGQLSVPWAAVADSTLNVYVADTGNSLIQKFAPISPYPSRPTVLTATAASSNQIQLNWTDNSNNEIGFDIFRKTGIRGNLSFLARISSADVTSYTDTTPDPGTYYYAVYAYSSAGYSA